MKSKIEKVLGSIPSPINSRYYLFVKNFIEEIDKLSKDDNLLDGVKTIAKDAYTKHREKIIGFEKLKSTPVIGGSTAREPSPSYFVSPEERGVKTANEETAIVRRSIYNNPTNKNISVDYTLNNAYNDSLSSGSIGSTQVYYSYGEEQAWKQNQLNQAKYLPQPPALGNYYGKSNEVPESYYERPARSSPKDIKSHLELMKNQYSEIAKRIEGLETRYQEDINSEGEPIYEGIPEEEVKTLKKLESVGKMEKLGARIVVPYIYNFLYSTQAIKKDLEATNKIPSSFPKIIDENTPINPEEEHVGLQVQYINELKAKMLNDLLKAEETENEERAKKFEDILNSEKDKVTIREEEGLPILLDAHEKFKGEYEKALVNLPDKGPRPDILALEAYNKRSNLDIIKFQSQEDINQLPVNKREDLIERNTGGLFNQREETIKVEKTALPVEKTKQIDKIVKDIEEVNKLINDKSSFGITYLPNRVNQIKSSFISGTSSIYNSAIESARSDISNRLSDLTNQSNRRIGEYNLKVNEIDTLLKESEQADRTSKMLKEDYKKAKERQSKVFRRTPYPNADYTTFRINYAESEKRKFRNELDRSLMYINSDANTLREALNNRSKLEQITELSPYSSSNNNWFNDSNVVGGSRGSYNQYKTNYQGGLTNYIRSLVSSYSPGFTAQDREFVKSFNEIETAQKTLKVIEPKIKRIADYVERGEGEEEQVYKDHEDVIEQSLYAVRNLKYENPYNMVPPLLDKYHMPMHSGNKPGKAREPILELLGEDRKKILEDAELAGARLNLLSPFGEIPPQGSQIEFDARDIAKMRLAGYEGVLEDKSKRQQYGFTNFSALGGKIDTNNPKGRMLVKNTDDYVATSNNLQIQNALYSINRMSKETTRKMGDKLEDKPSTDIQLYNHPERFMNIVISKENYDNSGYLGKGQIGQIVFDRASNKYQLISNEQDLEKQKGIADSLNETSSAIGIVNDALNLQSRENKERANKTLIDRYGKIANIDWGSGKASINPKYLGSIQQLLAPPVEEKKSAFNNLDYSLGIGRALSLISANLPNIEPRNIQDLRKHEEAGNMKALGSGGLKALPSGEESNGISTTGMGDSQKNGGLINANTGNRLIKTRLPIATQISNINTEGYWEKNLSLLGNQITGRFSLEELTKKNKNEYDIFNRVLYTRGL